MDGYQLSHLSSAFISCVTLQHIAFILYFEIGNTNDPFISFETSESSQRQY